MGKAIPKTKMPSVKTELRDECEHGPRLPDSKLSKSELEKRNRRRARNREAAARQRDKRVARVDGLENEKQEIEKSNQKLKMENNQLNPILVGLIPSPVYAIATSTASQPCFHFPVKA